MKSSGICPGEVITAKEATVETVKPWNERSMTQQDYTGVTNRTWSASPTIQIADGEVALVARADGSLVLHMPGPMDDDATQSQQLMMLASLLLSGTPMAKPVFDQVVDLRESNMELANADEDGLPN